MSDKKWKKADIIFCIIACILGVFFHFVYEWSGNNPAVAPFFPISESTWEHLKLIYFPVLLLSVPEYFMLMPFQRSGFWSTRFLSTIAGMILTVILFYTSTGVYGKNVDVLNVIIYFISMIMVYVLSYNTVYSKRKSNVPDIVGLLCFLLLILVFAFFTYFPPNIGLFQNPANDLA